MTAPPPPQNPLNQILSPVVRQLARLNNSVSKLAQGTSPQAQRFNLGMNLENRVIRFFTNLVGEIDELQKKSLSFGTTLDVAFAGVSDRLLKLPGGFAAGMDSALGLMQAGIKNPSLNILKLAIHARTVGQNTGKLNDTLARIQTSGRFDTDELGKDILNFVKTYGITSEILTDALANLTTEFPKFGLIGIGEQVARGSTMLLAALGPKFEEPLNKLLKGITQTGIEGATIAARVGITQERLAIQNAKTSMDVVKALVSAAQKSSDSIRRFTDGSSDKFLSLGIGLDVLGAEFLEGAAIISDKVGTVGPNLIRTIQENNEYANSISNFLSQLYDPFRILASVILPKITSLLSNNIALQFSQFFASVLTIVIAKSILGRLFSLLIGPLTVGGAANPTAAQQQVINARRTSLIRTTGIAGAGIGIMILLQNILAASNKTAEKTEESTETIKRTSATTFLDAEYQRRIAENSKSMIDDIRASTANAMDIARTQEQKMFMEKLLKGIDDINARLLEANQSKPVIPNRK